MSLTILNFAHPLTPEQQTTLEALADQTIDDIIQVKVQFDTQQPFLEQAHSLLEEVPLTAEDWQGKDIIINLPSLNHIAALLLALLHGKMGHFPTTLRLAPVAGATPPKFEVKELLNLQDVRDKGRQSRQL